MVIVIILLQIFIFLYNTYTTSVITKNQKEINNNILYLQSLIKKNIK